MTTHAIKLASYLRGTPSTSTLAHIRALNACTETFGTCRLSRWLLDIILSLYLSGFPCCFPCYSISLFSEREEKAAQVAGMDGAENRELKEVKVGNRGRGRSSYDLILRVLALVLTLVAAILLGVDKQTKVVPIKLVSTLPTLHVPVTARWHHLSAFV